MLNIHLLPELVGFRQITVSYRCIERHVRVCHGGSMAKAVSGGRGGRSQRDTVIHVTDTRTNAGIYIFSLVLQWLGFCDEVNFLFWSP